MQLRPFLTTVALPAGGICPTEQTMPKATLSSAVAVYLCVAVMGAAQTVVTDPVGFITTSCSANFDTYLGIPFTRPPEFAGTVQSATNGTITVNGTPGWITNQFVYNAGSQPKHFYVLIGNGGATNPKEGHIFPITGNSSGVLTIDTAFDNLSGVVANTKLTIIPYWTPATIFPTSDAGVSFTATTSPPSYQTQLIVPNTSSAGINLPPAATYFYLSSQSNTGWRSVGDNSTDHGDDPLLPDSYLIIRNGNGAPASALTAAGSVLLSKVAVPLMALGNQPQDNSVTMVRPVDVTLDATGLAPIDTSFITGDQLLLYNNSQHQFITYTFNDGWRVATDSLDHSKDVVPAGSAMIVRKASSPGGKTVYWLNSPTYVAPTSLLPLQAASRRGSFDVNLPIIGSNGIECRAVGSGYQVAFIFPNTVTVGGANAVPGTGATAAVSSYSVNGKRVTVNLSNVSNAQRLTINLTGVSDGALTNDISIPMAVLLGDTTGDGSVNSADISQTKAQSGQLVTLTNFRTDVTVDGSINSADISLVKARSGTALP